MRAQQLTFSISATDPNGDRVRIVMDWGDGISEPVRLCSLWNNRFSFAMRGHRQGLIEIRAQAVDENGASSAWSAEKEVQIQSAQTIELIISDRATGGWYLGSAYSRRRQAQSF